MKKRDKNKLARWLDQLQQESWQLELIVSGFAIFLLLAALNALDKETFIEKVATAGIGQEATLLQIGYIALSATCFFVLINLLLHVLLRGIWISSIGLRYISGDINFYELKFAPRFDRFLRRRIGSFDDYILRLENICSVVFAFTFLIVFMLVGASLYFSLYMLAVTFFENQVLPLLPESWANIVTTVGALLVFLTTLMYFIDFVSLGWLKRVRWLSVIYFPIYRFYSFITLSTLYRPLYYNLVDNKFGRRIGFLLVPYVLLVIMLLAFKAKSHGWFPDEPGKTALEKNYYDETRQEGDRVNDGSIPSKFVKNGFLELFIQYQPWPDETILGKICPDFKPFREAGFSSDVRFSTNSNATIPRPEAPDSALMCLSMLYEIQVDGSIFQNPVYRFYEHPNDEERGLLTILDVNGMARGPYELHVKKLGKEKINGRDTLLMKPFFTIPFWKE